MSLLVTLKTVKSGVSIILALTKELVDIREEVHKVYGDITDAHINSSIQALEASIHSNDSPNEIRSGINHLRDAFNVLRKSMWRTYTKKSWFSEKVINTEPDNPSIFKLIEVATSISVLYKELQEDENSKSWKGKALQLFKNYKVINLEALNDKSKTYDFYREGKGAVYRNDWYRRFGGNEAAHKEHIGSKSADPLYAKTTPPTLWFTDLAKDQAREIINKQQAELEHFFEVHGIK